MFEQASISAECTIVQCWTSIVFIKKFKYKIVLIRHYRQNDNCPCVSNYCAFLYDYFLVNYNTFLTIRAKCLNLNDNIILKIILLGLRKKKKIFCFRFVIWKNTAFFFFFFGWGENYFNILPFPQNIWTWSRRIYKLVSQIQIIRNIWNSDFRHYISIFNVDIKYIYNYD